MNEKIVIVISGGVVQSVYSSNDKIEIDLMDFDNEEFPNTEVADKEFKNRTQKLQPIF